MLHQSNNTIADRFDVRLAVGQRERIGPKDQDRVHGADAGERGGGDTVSEGYGT